MYSFQIQDMRRKVEELTKLLAMRKAKLKATENTLEKKSNVVDRVEKLLNSKERKATYIEKQKIEQLVYEKKVKKL
jgi:predicted component of type VI protein secretion system